MSASDQGQHRPEQRPDLRAALRILGEIERARGVKDTAEKQIESLSGALAIMVEAFPPSERDEFLRRLEEVQGRGPHKARITQVRDNVIAIFRQNNAKELTVPDIQEALTSNGAEPDLKSLYNTINYLATTGRLQRVARGKYMMKGVGAILDIDNVREDGTIRPSENDE
jgi:hypothetical protein